MVGRKVGNLLIVEKLGEGGMGSVYRAVDQLVQRNVAIKLLKPEHAGNAEVYERFHTEAVALARLNHPTIATLYSFFRESGEYFMVMEFVPGKNLDHIIQARGPLGWQSSCAILMRVLEGMKHAHSQGIIHRDLKPANIMLTPEGAVKITDFGIARMFYAPKLTRDQGVIGTVEYLAPERILGREADARSDVYSLGVVFYEISTGRLPFHSTTEFELMKAQVEQRPRSFAELGLSMPAAVEQAVLRALEKDPQLRPQNASGFADELAAAMYGSGTELPGLAGAFDLGPKETSTSFMQAGLPPVPKETVYVPLSAAKETVYVSPAMKETVVVPRAPAIAMPFAVAKPSGPPLSRKLVWGGPAILLAAGLGVFGFLQFSKQRPESAVVPVSSRPAPVLGTPISSTPAEPSAPAPEPAAPVDPSPTQPPVTPPLLPEVKPEVKPAVKPLPKPQVKPQVNPAPTVPPEVKPAEKAADSRPAAPREPVVESSSVKRLADVKRLYLRPGSTPEFDGFLRERLEAELAGQFSLAASAGGADAVIVVAIEDQHGNVTDKAGRVFGLKSGKKATAIIQDASGKHQLWRVVIDDRHNIATAMRDDMKRLASRIAKKLRSDMR